MGEQLILCKLCDPPRRHRLGERHVVKGYSDASRADDRPSGFDRGGELVTELPAPGRPESRSEPISKSRSPRHDRVAELLAGSAPPLDKLTPAQLRQRVIVQRTAKRIAQAKWRAKQKDKQ